jgi:ATP-dependent DNA helicase RecQ
MIESGEADGARKRVEHAKLGSLFAFLETAGCRRQALLGYFGEHTAPCGNCDTCISPVQTWDGTVAAQKALSNIYRTGQRFGAAYLADVLTGKESERSRRFGHHELSTWGIGGELSGEQWKSVYRQLAATGLLTVDMERHSALTLNERSWPVLRGEAEVRLRTDPVVTTRSARTRTPVTADDVLSNQEAQALFDALRELRLGVAGEQGVPPYAIFPDKTLLDMVRYRPEDLDAMACMTGVGEVKLERFGQTFLDCLLDHADKYGRPPDTPDIPQDRLIKRQQRLERPASTALSATAEESLAIFEELGSVEAVAGRRGLKPGSVWSHLGQAVALGRLDYRRAVGLPDAEIDCILSTFADFRARGVTALTPVHDALDGNYSYDVLRMVRAGGARE